MIAEQIIMWGVVFVFYEDCIIQDKSMSLCEILLMALINSEKSIISGINLSSFHGLSFICMFYKKSHAQAGNLSSCHRMGNIVDFQKNRRISGKICLLTPILQGGIAFFAVFMAGFMISWKIARNGKRLVALPDLGNDSGFPEKSIILRNNLLPFHGMVHDRIFPEKSHDSSSELMSINYVGIDFVKTGKVTLLVVTNKYTITPIKINLIKDEKSNIRANDFIH